MKTLNENYIKNVNILKENIKRGLSYNQAVDMVENFEKQFIKYNLYNDDEKAFIQQLNDVIDENFKRSVKVTDLARDMGITVINM